LSVRCHGGLDLLVMFCVVVTSSVLPRAPHQYISCSIVREMKTEQDGREVKELGLRLLHGEHPR
jgi:hypothetical protein